MGSLRPLTHSVNLKQGADLAKLQEDREAEIIKKLEEEEENAELAGKELTKEESNNVVVSDSLDKFAKARNMFERRATLSRPLLPVNPSYANEPLPKKKDTHRLVEDISTEELTTDTTTTQDKAAEDEDNNAGGLEIEKVGYGASSVKDMIAKQEKTISVKRNFVVKKKPEWDRVAPEFVEAFWYEYEELHGDFYNGYAIRGWRPGMEDVMDSFFTRNADLKQLFAVYDGHGGDECALYCKEYLLKRLALHSDLHKNPKTALADSFVSVDAKYIEKATSNGSMAGTTATVLYMTPVLNAEKKRAYKYYLACVGDSRAVLVYNTGHSVPLSDDHHLTRKDELQRIKEGGGEIYYDNEFDEILVYSGELERGLNVTRTIGDKDFKPLVTAFPEISDGYLDDNCGYIIIASDGLWGKVSNEEAGRVLLEYGTKQGVKNLANLANARGSFDNVTVLAIDIKECIDSMKRAYPEK
eukprot:CAMPEP_0204860924 /NCGR_PEP_ID=MMETSP1348-20121228/1031_1 /ASSEMBLY_ACC=CAM_ASM_000700 /TAXON_ID=215587 /ORGANISM="Aplanochytrium stocchinoi, Strain GSBS06" /LENGTH=469 /DNA_ID=CAMNT_0052009993 /DNA_START=295 /DNA_END=1704 /DNA_ORIENTATION=-